MMMQWLTRWKLSWQARRQQRAEGAASNDESLVAFLNDRLGRAGWITGAALLLLFLYFGVGGIALSTVDDDLAFRPSPADLPPGGSVAVAMSSGLLDRELNTHRWTPDDPWFFPTGLIDNMPAFQTGMRQTTQQFLLELKDQVARARGSGSTAPDLEKAFADLSYPPDRWWLGTDWPWIRGSSTSYYRDAVTELRRYNSRVGNGQALFERRADTLNAVLDRLALSLGSASAQLDQHVANHAGKGLIDWQSDNVFYNVRGQAYAAHMILRGLREDYGGLIRQRELATVWGELMRSLEALIAIDPLIVANSDPQGLLINNHLTAQGVLLMRARTELREITAILQK